MIAPRAMLLASLLAPLVTVAPAAVFKHPTASVDVPGKWTKDASSNAETLVLQSDPAGRQLVVSVLHLKQAPKSPEEAAPTALEILELRLQAFLKLSEGTGTVGKPTPELVDGGVSVVCTAHAPKQKVRMAVRVEATVDSDAIRSTSVYDYSGMTEEEFVKWSGKLLAGVK